jgi:hypothetical protein
MRYTFITLILLQLAACGFTPLHQTREHSLNQVEIAEIKGEQAHVFRGYLEDAMYFDQSDEVKSIKLDVELVKTSDTALLTKDHTILRKDLNVVAKYTLRRMKDSRIIDTGTVKVIGGLEEVKSPFASFVQEEKIHDDSLKEIARLLKIKVSLALR